MMSPAGAFAAPAEELCLGPEMVTRRARGAKEPVKRFLGGLALHGGLVTAGSCEAVELRALREGLLARDEIGRGAAPGFQSLVLQGTAIAERERPRQRARLV